MPPVLIPEFSLPQLRRWNVLQPAETTDYTLSSVESGAALQDFPYRVSFYGIGLCRQGSVELHANLARYPVHPDSLLVMGPDIIRQWRQQSADYHTVALFFTEAFFVRDSATATLLRRGRFFQADAPQVLPLRAEEAAAIWQVLAAVRRVVAGDSPRQELLVRSYAHILTHLAADCHDRYVAAVPSAHRSVPELVRRFQQLVSVHYLHRRLVSEYADLLCVTPKHLGETVKAATGKAAGDWIADMLTLEATVQLQQTTRSIGQIADALGFGDVSAFGKFFRRQTGLTPAAYRRRTQA